MGVGEGGVGLVTISGVTLLVGSTVAVTVGSCVGSCVGIAVSVAVGVAVASIMVTPSGVSKRPVIPSIHSM